MFTYKVKLSAVIKKWLPIDNWQKSTTEITDNDISKRPNFIFKKLKNLN